MVLRLKNKLSTAENLPVSEAVVTKLNNQLQTLVNKLPDDLKPFLEK